MRRFLRHCHSLVEASCKRHHTPSDIQLGEKKKKTQKKYLKTCRVKHHGTYILLRAHQTPTPQKKTMTQP